MTRTEITSPRRGPRGATIRRSIVALVVACLAPTLAAHAERVVAVGDIHGEFDGFVGILRAAGLIDESQHWVGGDATLVQTGDFTDRGRDVRRVMDLLMALQEEARSAGGRAIVLMGNHEQLNLAGELRPEYVTAEICAAFAEEGSEARRTDAYREWVKWQEKNPYFPPRSEEQWRELYPLGYFEYLDAIGPEGAYGRWMRTLPVAVKVGDTVFLHGGIGPKYLDHSIEKINKAHFDGQAALDEDRRFLVRQGTILPFFSLEELNQAIVGSLQQRGQDDPMSEHEKYMFRKTINDLNELGRLLDGDSPLWFRGYHSLDDEGLGELVRQLNETYDSKHFVVAHTVQPSAEIWSRLDGAIFLIDTGMLSSHYGGRASALEISDGRFTAIYPNDRTVLLDGSEGNALLPAVSRRPAPDGVLSILADLARAAPAPQHVGQDGYAWPGPDGTPLPFKTHGEIRDYLLNAEVVEVEDIPTGVTRPKKVTLERNGVRAQAAFRDVSVDRQRARMADGTIAMHLRDSYLNEVAAYELGLLLGITNIPPAVLRTVHGKEGSLQLWIPGTVPEKERLAQGQSAPDQIRFRRQVFDMDVFDALINNLDRNQGNILWDANWNLWMIDHTRSFGKGKTLRKPEEIQMVSRRLYEALQNLDTKQAEGVLERYMGAFERKDVTKRHKALLEQLQAMVAEQGEDSVVFEYE
jgi:hypothetical protein